MGHAGHFDAVIAGGGLAGTSTARALGELGLRVLVAEAGADHPKLLSGELIQEGGVSDLASLGLLAQLESAQSTRVSGFAVFSAADLTPAASRTAASTASTEAEILSYPRQSPLVPYALAIERTTLASTLRGILAGLPGVEVWMPARVTGHCDDGDGTVTVRFAAAGGERRVTTRLLIAADGRNSAVRRAARLQTARSPAGAMLGYVIEGAQLPHAGFGHLFVGGPSPLLAYPLAGDAIRVMFDVPGEVSVKAALARLPEYARVLPTDLRERVRSAIATQAPSIGSTQSVIPRAVARGRVVLVGDAAGCCHPLSASGLSFAVRDALWLRQAVEACDGDPVRATQRYARLRADAQRTRFLLADILVNVFSARTPAMRLLCAGTIRHWRAGSAGREATMSLLAAHETRLAVLARQYLNGVRECLGEAKDRGRVGTMNRWQQGRALAGVVRESSGYLVAAAHGRLFIPRRGQWSAFEPTDVAARSPLVVDAGAPSLERGRT